MRKLIVAATVVVVGLGACGGQQEASTGNPAVRRAEAQDAAGVVDGLKAAGLPITKVAVYDASNDPNSLLGRPGQYTSKVNFTDEIASSKTDGEYDITLCGEPADMGVECGGSVEVFDSPAEAATRYEYVKALAKGSSLLAEYDYLSGVALVRVSNLLTPAQASKYEQAIEGI